ncbi:transcription elongation factor GreA [Christensenellaceae bacterium OttesenSCG-928-L17]|nr:transcription elongation factor GreA [Christensenellaceae bacterium OttesenSCG-928-L17]
MAEARLTREGIEKYEEKLEHLKTTRRMEIAEQIKIARSFGDLSENAEYDAAKNEQAKNEYDILQLENMLRNAVIIDQDTLDTETVNVGATVVLKNAADKTKMTFQIVGSAEADPMQGRISNESPVGQAIIGHKVGENVDVQTPGGVMKMKILEIKKS